MLTFTGVKINIGLDILRRRPDGYHDISTAMIPVGWSDILEAVPSADGTTRLHCSGKSVDCPAEKNLVMKAYRALADELGIPPVDIYLHKNVPDGAGLGGGSADAAFTLRCLNDLFSLGLSDDELAGKALSIGADCPFFIYNRPMLAECIGERLTPINNVSLRGYSLGIVKPPTRISTAEAYAGVTPRLPSTPLAELLTLPVDRWQGTIVNAFEDSVFPNHPELPRIKETLLDMGAAYASMSGSGSAIYGLFADGDDLSARLGKKFPDCDIFSCRM